MAKSVLSLFLVPLLVFAGSGSAAAQGTCECQLANAGGGVVATVIQASGSVLFAGDGGLVAVSAGAGLSVGDELSTGPSSTASVDFNGNCQISLGANSQIAITPQGNGYCVNKTSNIAETIFGNGETGGIAIAAAAAAGAVIVALGLTDPVSD